MGHFPRLEVKVLEQGDEQYMTSGWRRVIRWAGGATGIALIIGFLVLAGYADTIAGRYIRAKAHKGMITQEVYDTNMAEMKKLMQSMERMTAQQTANSWNVRLALEKHGVKVEDKFKADDFLKGTL